MGGIECDVWRESKRRDRAEWSFEEVDGVTAAGAWVGRREDGAHRSSGNPARTPRDLGPQLRH